jgi:hypothetical protein
VERIVRMILPPSAVSESDVIDVIAGWCDPDTSDSLSFAQLDRQTSVYLLLQNSYLVHQLIAVRNNYVNCFSHYSRTT